LPDTPRNDLLTKWRSGSSQALEDLLPMVYEELRRAARAHLRGERANHTLQTTALIHEAYLRLVGSENLNLRNENHFVALASRVMRQVLVDHARNHLTAKRDGGIRVAVGEALQFQTTDVDLLAIDEALTRLGRMDEQQAQVVELRFFGGLSIDETSQALNISPATVKRDWSTARAWLRRELDVTGAA
jgi:RNA polymerase sigma factor (TIGR02999 family)